MIRSNNIRLALAVGAIAVAGTGCGRLIEKATEEAVEQAIESDSGEEVEIDFSDGEIRVESEEGDITFSADEDGVQIDGTDADGNDFSVDADENGLEVDSENGVSLDVDEDGSFVATDEDGEVFTGDVDEDGLTVEGEDGEAVFATTEGVPPQWPSDVPQPQGLSDITGTYFSDGEEVSIVITGTASGGLQDVFDEYRGQLEDAGFEEQSTFTQGDEAANATYLRGDSFVAVTVQSQGDDTEVVIALN